jgi:DNA modification methylase
MTHLNTIVNDDCLKVLPHLAAESVHFILTDPPYITRYKARDGRTVSNDDNAAWLKLAFAEMFRVLAPDSFAVSFYGWPQADRFIWAYRDAGFRVVGHFVFRSGTPPRASLSATSTNALICWPKATRSGPPTP